MPKRILWEGLLEVIGRMPEGASLEEIMLGMNPTVPRRTLQRWLTTLIKQGQVTAIGNARSRQYKLTSVPNQARRKDKDITHFVIPLDQEAEQTQSKISKPIQLRRPVTYHREFLENYQPNITYYLPKNLRHKLLEMGKVEEGKYPAGTYARHIFHRLLIDLSWNSSRLEGNTYSLLETERLIVKGQAGEDKDLKETQMILNHKAAIEFLINSAELIGVNRHTILNLHTLLSDNLMPNPAACGRVRSLSVGIAKSVYQPCAIPQVINECFDLLLSKANQIEDPLEQAFFLMVQIPYLQPFEDVNKRTSRLAANIPLIRNNLCPLSFIDVPEQTYINGLLGIYELNQVELLRDVFAWAYERSCALYATTRSSIGEPDPFRMKYRKAIQQTVREIVCNMMNKAQAIGTIRQVSLEVIPINDQPRFIEVIERELQSLHEGNIVRYQLNLTEYESWKKSWN